MIYTELTIKAMQIAEEYHRNQKDKAGAPYVFHVYAVGDMCTSEYSVCVGLLHDVLEDTDCPEELLEQNFPIEIVDAIRAMTRPTDVSYIEYIKKLKQNSIAREVKLNDLKHNMLEQREKLCIGGKSETLKKRYIEAFKILSQE